MSYCHDREIKTTIFNYYYVMGKRLEMKNYHEYIVY